MLPASVNTADATVADLLAHHDGTPASYLRVARALECAAPGVCPLDDARVALLATFTVDLIAPYLVVEGARRGLAVRLSLAPFAQLEQQVLDADSAVYRTHPDVVILALRIEDAAPALGCGYVGLESPALEGVLEEHVRRVAGLVRAVRERSDAHILVWNQAPLRRVAAGLADAGLAVSQSGMIADLNGRLAAACRAVAGASVFDVSRAACEVGLDRWEDPKLAAIASAPLSAAALVAVAKRLSRTLRALRVPARKCLVLDLDNTLWGGVLGEDGPGGVALGDTYPGNIYRDFQRLLASYRDRGILLALASKNNEADVSELFQQRTDMVLRLEDFAARRVGWDDKATSLAAIARELNIGTDALAFFDDSPAEREWVRTRMPEVHVIEVPPDPLRYGDALEESGAFDALVITAEDRARAEQYRSESARQVELGAAAGSVEDFLRRLEMRVHIGTVDALTLPRVSQLIAKTNQFNLTTRRHSTSQLAALLDAGAIALCMRVEDRFGDSGLVGVAIAVDAAPDTFAIDTFLLSCRVLGRRVERALLRAVAARARGRGAAWLEGEFVPTPKNAPAARFFEEHGFEPIGGRTGWWRLALADAPPAPDDIYEVVEW